MSDIMLSVLVLTYNQEKYIEKTLESILSQTHEYSYEIVIGEDCSKDNTKKIVEEFVEKYPEIIKPIYNNPNRGLIGNYFNSIAQCKGKYIMECAGDDWWLPGKISTQIEFMESHDDVGMCYGKAKVWNESKQRFEKKSCGDIRETFEDLLLNNNIPALSVCFRNDVFRRYIDEIDPEHQNWGMEDYPAWLWFSKESKIKFIDKELAGYRLLENSVSHNVNIEKQLAFERNVSEIKNYYRIKYGFSVINFNEEETRNWLFYRKILQSYDKESAKELRKELNKKKSLRNLVKVFFISNKLLAIFGKYIIKFI